ncbi:Uncharacterised protein [Actinomyces bovis]|uniref:Tetratricopeptide repeat n=1 Tax=Actinomyces bovis TaxID=1658 RepID=A0ABY1VPX7_9ACTO|nr:hypothetical protein [Actinomyces bovis]SPT54180.1 Uncharacterised protein [Actinomyces bovis]VEG53532.1 Uncharacterised protein [Actinomyces israelii]
MPYQRRNDHSGPRRGNDRHGFGNRSNSGGPRRSRDDKQHGGYQQRDGQRRSWRDRDDKQHGGYQQRDGQRRSWRDRDDKQYGGGRPRREGDFDQRDRRDRPAREDSPRQEVREWSPRGERRSWRDRDDKQRDGQRRGGRNDRDGKRSSRAPQHARIPEPRLPEDVEAGMLEASARRELRALGRLNAENVARHLVMLQRLLETDPEEAYQHARYATSHAGRIAVVRESAGIAAYLAGHYQEALGHIRAARRLSGLDLHHAIEADCERALGRLDQALKVAAAASPKQLDDLEEAEIAMVVSGIRSEMGQPELGLVVIEDAIRLFRGDRETLRRMHSVRADRLTELGRGEEADLIRARIGITAEGEDQEYEEPEEELVAYDLEEDYEPEDSPDVDSKTESNAGAEAEDLAEAEDEAETADWPASFSVRVEAELAEILEDAGIEDQTGEATQAQQLKDNDSQSQKNHTKEPGE